MFFFFFKQKTAYEMRISDWSFRRVLFRSATGEAAAMAADYLEGDLRDADAARHRVVRPDERQDRPRVIPVAAAPVRTCGTAELAAFFGGAVARTGSGIVRTGGEACSQDRTSTRLNSSN